MEIEDSAYRHGVEEEDIRHAWAHLVVEVSIRRTDNMQVWIGEARDGRLLEIGVLDFYGQRIIHAMRLRRNWYRFITGEDS